MAQRPIPLDFQSGTQRDGTRVDSKRYLDSLWCRWRTGRPRKMLGYNLIIEDLQGVPRKIHMYYKGDQAFVHVGTAKKLTQVILDSNGNYVSQSDRTPAAFRTSENINWTLDGLFDTTSDEMTLVAHAAPNLGSIASDQQTQPYLGLIDATTPLTVFPPPIDLGGGTYATPMVAGGIVCVQPYVFAYGFDGSVRWSAPNLPADLGITGGTTGAGRARVSSQKVIAGAPLRGGGINSPAALFWTLSEVITANYVGFPAYFSFNTVSPSSSILSANSVIEYDGLYFWPGVDRFLVYNGTVVEVPNEQNQDWFFDNITPGYAGKAFSFKIPRWGEIWFCAPLFGATECSHAAILNLREKTWYDTELPNGGRGAGYFAQGLPHPVMSGVAPGADGYKLWLHERGLDETGDGDARAVRSYFETPFMGGPTNDPPTDNALSFQQIECDHVQSGDMSVYVVGGANPRAKEYADDPVALRAIPQVAQDQIPGIKTERRLGRLHFESNCLNGNYIVGKSLLHGDESSDKKSLGALGTALTEDQ